MKRFGETFKLYSYKNRDRCDLSIRVHDTLVLTFKLTHGEFKQLLDNADTVDGVQLNSQAGNFWYVLKKKSVNAIRITVAIAGVDFNFRIPYNDWEELKRDYAIQMTSEQPWDNK